MFNSAKIDRLTRLATKGLEKVIKAGKKIIETYKGTEPKIHKLEIIVATLEDALDKLQKISKEEKCENLEV